MNLIIKNSIFCGIKIKENKNHFKPQRLNEE
jgi:hypothetical protein